MTDPFFQLDWQRIETISELFQNRIIELLQEDRGVRIEDAISGAAAVAGCQLLRATGMSFADMEPGTMVLVEEVNESGIRHLGFLSAICDAFDIDPSTGWTDPIPDNNRPGQTISDLTDLLEIPFLDICGESDLEEDLRPRLAVFTAAKLIKAGEEILDPDIGKAIALASLVGGSKTVPNRA